MHIQDTRTRTGKPCRPFILMLAALAVLALASPAAMAAIALYTVPNGLQDTEGGASSDVPFGNDMNCGDGIRYQQVINGDQVAGGNIGALAFRLDGGQSDDGPFTYTGVRVALSSTEVSSTSMNLNFTDNVGIDNQVVFSGDINVDPTSTAMNPNPFDFEIPVDDPFPFDPSSSNLLVDITIEGCPNASFFLDAVSGNDDTLGLFANDKDNIGGIFVNGLVVEMVSSTPPPTPPLYNCPAAGGGDGLHRGFLLEAFPTNNLGRVRLTYRTNGTGFYRVRLTARQDSYEGAIIGRQVAVFEATSNPEVIAHTYDFRNADVRPGSTIAFTQEVISASGSIFYDRGPCGLGGGGCAECPDVTQTDDTTPQLDTFRRASVAVTVLDSSPLARMRGLGSNWRVVDRSGEGFMIHVTDRDQLVAIWFTYDDNGEQMWIFGSAQDFTTNAATMDAVVNSGPTFFDLRGDMFDSGLFMPEPWGQFHIRFEDCDSAVVNYESTTGFGSGSFEIERLYTTEQGICP